MPRPANTNEPATDEGGGPAAVNPSVHFLFLQLLLLNREKENCPELVKARGEPPLGRAFGGNLAGDAVHVGDSALRAALRRNPGLMGGG